MTRTRSSTGTRCEAPGCTTRATAMREPTTITVNGHPLVVTRLCAEHRPHKVGRTARGARARGPHPAEGVPGVVYRCHGCNAVHARYATAERCADTHGGARIGIEAAP